MKSQGSIQVIAGKGGVGKTSISAIFTRLLANREGGLLVIDADPMANLAYSLGEVPGKTIGDYRQSVIENQSERQDLISRPMKTLIREMVKKSDNGFDLLAMGRAEGKGCFCGVNEMLRHGIQSVSGEYDLTLIDCEAGVEQVNRRTVHRIDKLILVTDSSRRGLATLVEVRNIATKYNEGAPMIDYVVVNRIRNESDREITRRYANELGFANIGFIPEDPNVLDSNCKGQTLFQLPDDSPSVQAVRDIIVDIERLYSEQVALS